MVLRGNENVSIKVSHSIELDIKMLRIEVFVGSGLRPKQCYKIA